MGLERTSGRSGRSTLRQRLGLRAAEHLPFASLAVCAYVLVTLLVVRTTGYAWLYVPITLAVIAFHRRLHGLAESRTRAQTRLTHVEAQLEELLTLEQS